MYESFEKTTLGKPNVFRVDLFSYNFIKIGGFFFMNRLWFLKKVLQNANMRGANCLE